MIKTTRTKDTTFDTMIPSGYRDYYGGRYNKFRSNTTFPRTYIRESLRQLLHVYETRTITGPARLDQFAYVRTKTPKNQ